MGASFNLLTEKWIPVLWNDGRRDEPKVGILEALTQAGRIRQVAATNPMDRVAILRFLLALLYWCKGNPEDSEVIAISGFPEEWLSKLGEFAGCFDLLGEEVRFYQDKKTKHQRAVTDLLQEVPTGNNFWHFRHATDYVEGLCPACCAMGLLRLPLFSVSGLPNLKSGINGSPPVYILRWGSSLMETLKANWSPVTDLGEPAWINPVVRPKPGETVPLLTGLTLLSRRVWLHEPAEPAGPCIACGGEHAALIRNCEYQSAGEQENVLWNDPHVLYTSDEPRKTTKAADLTKSGKFVMDRPWPSLLARILGSRNFNSDKEESQLLIVGFATDKAKNIDVWERFLQIPAAVSIPQTTPAILEQWQRASGQLISKLRPFGETKSRRHHVEIPPMVAAIRPHVEDRVSARVGKLLVGGDSEWEKAATEYRPMMEMLAKALAPGFTSSALQRQQQIAAVLPTVRPIDEAAKGRVKKKGGKM